MLRRLAAAGAAAGLLALAASGGGAALAAESTCKPGAPLENDPIANVPHPEETVPPVVIGCWKVSGGRIQVHGRRMKPGGKDQLCLGTQNKVVCASWAPKKGQAIAGSSCGGGDGFIFVEGTVSARVKRVDVRFKDAAGKRRVRQASIVWLKGEVAERLRVKRPFGYYHGETVKGAYVIETLARDRDGRVLGRLKGSSCNEPR